VSSEEKVVSHRGVGRVVPLHPPAAPSGCCDNAEQSTVLSAIMSKTRATVGWR
jgi:hypothetical protein